MDTVKNIINLKCKYLNCIRSRQLEIRDYEKNDMPFIIKSLEILRSRLNSQIKDTVIDYNINVLKQRHNHIISMPIIIDLDETEESILINKQSEIENLLNVECFHNFTKRQYALHQIAEECFLINDLDGLLNVHSEICQTSLSNLILNNYDDLKKHEHELKELIDSFVSPNIYYEPLKGFLRQALIMCVEPIGKELYSQLCLALEQFKITELKI